MILKNGEALVILPVMPQRMSGTSIAPGSSRLSRTQFLAMSEGVDKTLNKAHMSIRDIMRTLALSDSVYARCFDILKYMDDNDFLRNRTNSSWMLAVVYMACRQERAGRQISELVRAAPTVKESEVARNYWRLDKLLAGAPVRASNQPFTNQGDSYVVRYCNRLNLQSTEKLAEHLTNQANRYGITGSRNPGATAGVAILIAAHLLNLPNRPSIDDIARVTDIKATLIKQTYTAMRQPIDRLLPADTRNSFLEAIQTLP
jgi:transcription initiation factor TFIIB